MSFRFPVHVRVAGLFCSTLISLSQGQAAPQAATDSSTSNQVEFNRDIRPILSDKCYTCHGPSKQMGALRFDREEAAKRPLNGGRFAIVPGDPTQSQILQRIAATSPAVRMPLGGEQLSAREIETVRRWIEQGAVWQKHWSFIPPKRPDIPKVKDASWAHNAIDSFVLQRLEQEGLKPSTQADRTTLLRRVTLDLTGLPPTLIEMDAFLADKSPNAYEKVVDRLLKSPRYAERMANPWLDAARYADSNGYQSDNERQMWRWRDWVIDAFNRNMPFNQFTIEQLAGDLLPNPTLDQKIATGFNRNHRGNSEGGVIPEEYQVEYVVDRVDTTSTVFLGLTVGCARCHDHKYDPIAQKEYYQLFSYFNNVPESGKARKTGNSPPFIKAPTPEQQVQLKQFDDGWAAANDKFQRLNPEAAQKEWEKSLNNSKPVAWSSSRGLVAHYALDGDLSASISMTQAGKSSAPEVRDGEAHFVPGQLSQAAGFDGKRFIQAGDIAGFGRGGYGNGDYDDKYTLAAWIYPTAPTGAILTKAPDEDEPDGHGMMLKDGKLQYFYINDWLFDGIRLQTEKTLSLNQWHQVTLTYDGTRVADGVKVFVDGAEWKWEILLDDLNSAKRLKRQPVRIGAGGGPKNRFQGSISEVRIYNRALSPSEVAVLADPKTVTEIATLPEAKRSPVQADKIRDYFLENAASANVRDAWKQVVDLRERREKFYENVQTAMVMEEMPTPRESHILIRGTYDRPGEKVVSTVPAILPPMPADSPKNRLGLARWLVDPSNPLTARVTVNRFWQMYFGTGIVKTVEDFGSQGEPPSHPELLDWLATEFVRTGWDVKALQKTIVMSATYQQSSKATSELVQKDPENRLLARGPNFRLSPEMVRDQALAIAGLLTEKLGGPSVMPYQPQGLWKDVNSQDDYKQDHGADLYRRSMYTYWKRSVVPPTMANFDASSRESSTVRHNVTNTPLQALDLMNDVTFMEAARVFAQRMMKEGGTKPQDRIAFGFRLATARLPNAAESSIMLDSFNYQLDGFKTNLDAAVKYISQGEYPRDQHLDTNELAAYTSVASLILNLNQTVMKE